MNRVTTEAEIDILINQITMQREWEKIYNENDTPEANRWHSEGEAAYHNGSICNYPQGSIAYACWMLGYSDQALVS